MAFRKKLLDIPDAAVKIRIHYEYAACSASCLLQQFVRVLPMHPAHNRTLDSATAPASAATTAGSAQSSALTAVVAVMLLMLVCTIFAHCLRNPTVGRGSAAVLPQPRAETADQRAVAPPAWQPDKHYFVRLAKNFRDRTQDLVELSALRMELYFSEKQQGVAPFCEDVNGYRSTGRFVLSHVPWLDPNQWKNRTLHSFRKHLFSAEQLSAQFESEIQNFQLILRQRFAESVTETNTALMLELGPDIAAQLPVAEEVEQALFRSLQSSTEVQQQMLQSALTTEIASQIVSAVAFRIVRTASGTAVGAAATPATAGISLAAGILFDQLVSTIWNWYSDPQGELQAKLLAHLTDLQQTVIGDSDNPEAGSLCHGLQTIRQGMLDSVLTLHNQQVAHTSAGASVR